MATLARNYDDDDVLGERQLSGVCSWWSGDLRLWSALSRRGSIGFQL